jgi:hypothetical protein
MARFRLMAACSAGDDDSSSPEATGFADGADVDVDSDDADVDDDAGAPEQIGQNQSPEGTAGSGGLRQ